MFIGRICFAVALSTLLNAFGSVGDAFTCWQDFVVLVTITLASSFLYAVMTQGQTVGYAALVSRITDNLKFSVLC